MKKNVGTVDSFLRIGSGLFLLTTFAHCRHPFLMALGAMETASGISRFCPCYKIMGISTADSSLPGPMKNFSKNFSSLS